MFAKHKIILSWPYSVYIKQLRQFCVYTYLLTCLTKNTSVLLKIVIFEKVHKYKKNGLNFLKSTVYMRTTPFIKLYKILQKENTHRTPSHANSINFPERV